MRARTMLGFAIILSATVAGCTDEYGTPQPAQQKAASPRPPAGQTPGKTAAPAPTPVSEAKDVWNQSQVEQVVREELKLNSLQLKSAGGPNYTGTGTGANGKTYSIEVKQVPGGIRVNWTKEGGQGEYRFGNEVP